MASSVELRVPFLDHRIVEFAISIPNKYKLKWIVLTVIDSSINCIRN